ncbi:hypothetical protein [Flavobacterium degerlachei]|uniref:hypothetical protein n=1 Tax=Flavobacterium degerlachei TaxID=229203 RepID=UPI002936DC4B|nr:hypothetical protein [Flavobacterium degerlachei]
MLKLNKAISFTFSNISFPPMIPFIIYGSLRLGGEFIHSDSPSFLDKSITFTYQQQYWPIYSGQFFNGYNHGSHLRPFGLCLDDFFWCK